MRSTSSGRCRSARCSSTRLVRMACLRADCTDDPSLVEVGACGDGCLLLRRLVLEAIPAPRWEFRGELNHDLVFSGKIRQAGFQIYADLNVRVGHVLPITAWPQRTDDGTWQVALCPRADSREGLLLDAPVLQ